MTTLGIIGGIGAESTIDYYRSIVTSYREAKTDGGYPTLIINSINFAAMFELVSANRLTELTVLMADSVKQLAAAGADFGLIASNTPHIVFDDICSRSPIPLLSIVDVTVASAKRSGYRNLGLFGARYTMQGGFYARACAKEGITVVTPDEREQDYIHSKYMSELVGGIFLPETRQQLVEIARALKSRHGLDAIILGGTELPLILRETETSELPYLDTAQLHIDAAVARLIGQAK
jgi:aspartate racemase